MTGQTASAEAAMLEQMDGGRAPSEPGSREPDPRGSGPPSRDEWFCERGNFWGTANQLCLCAKCGKSEIKRYNEPRHYSGLFTPYLHMLCDECFEALPDEEEPTCDSNGSPKGGGK